MHSAERDHARDTETTVSATPPRGVSVVRGGAPPAGIAPSCPPCEQQPDDIASLMERIAALESKMDLGGSAPDLKSERAESARKVRDDFFSKANLDEQQRAAVEPIVAQLDEALKAPLDRLAALESAEHYAVSDWAQARVDVYQAMSSAEQSLRALLSPQQRESLDNTEFSLASQLGVERYEALVGRGLFIDTATFIEETPAK